MRVYVAIVCGNYRHAIIGVYTEQALARSKAEEFVTNEADHYHSVDLVECILDVTPQEENLVATCEAIWTPSYFSGTFAGVRWSDEKASTP